jgi:site-specific recombinase XerD
LRDILEDWKAFCEAQPEEHVVRGLASAGRLTDNLTSAQVFNIVRKYGKAIGKPELEPHDTRCTYAQLGYEAGVDIAQLPRLLGHSSVSVTQRYLNL